MKEAYIEMPNFKSASVALIGTCDEIVAEYQAQGFRLTVRQIYYQLVARGHIPNTVQSYNNVQALLNNARLAGLIDWDAIEDRTRNVMDRPHWTTGGEILEAVATQYHEDLWADQPYRVFVIVEKEALAGVLEDVCREFDMPLLPARGYPSASILREMAKERIMRSRQSIVILHLGDHDPSGIDMTRDLIDRFEMFSRQQVDIDFRRIALNMDQVIAQNPPPNPAKVTDSRYRQYRDKYGDESWELDALTPTYLREIIEKEVNELIDFDKWNEKKDDIRRVQERLQEIANEFDA